MATPDGFKVRTARVILAIALLCGAVLNTGAAFSAAFGPLFKNPPELQVSGSLIKVCPPAPARHSRGIERIEAMLLAERAVAVSA